MRRGRFIFAAAGSLMIIALTLFINVITSWGHPWFIYPTFVVLWWPLSVYFAAKKKYALFSIVGSALIIAFFLLVNLITSPHYLWFIFPAFAVLWWPLAMLVAKNGKYKLFSIIGSLLTAVFFLVINMMSSPNTIWFIYPVFAVFWWPISQILCGLKKYKLYSIVTAVYTVMFFVLINLLVSPSYLWFYYPAFAVAWWPLSMFFANKRYIKIYSVVTSLSIIAFLGVINLLNTPDNIWFYHIIFFLIWWPVVTLLGSKAKTLAFSVISAVVIIAYFVFVYYWQTPGIHPWYLYIIFPAVWWPVCMAFRKHIAGLTFLIISLAAVLLYYGALNLIFSPTYIWTVYLLYPAIWAAMVVFFGSRKQYFALSICASVVTIIFFTIVNIMSSPNYIWAVYPSFAVLWWPLSLYFFKVRKIKHQ